MTTRGNIRIGSVFISMFAVEKGFELGPDGIDGWNDGVDMRQDEIPIPGQPGSFDVPGDPASRMITIPGRCVAPSMAEMGWYHDVMTGLLVQGNSGQVIVEEFDRTTWATGRLAGRTKWVQWGGQPYADFKLQLWFPNPRKFGEPMMFPNAKYTLAQVHHWGNFSATPVLTVTGSEPAGYTISGPSGKQFVVTRALEAGHPHTIDMATGLLEVDGVVVFGGVSRADTWAVPAGSQVTMTVSGSAVLSALVADTYI